MKGGKAQLLTVEKKKEKQRSVYGHSQSFINKVDIVNIKNCLKFVIIHYLEGSFSKFAQRK